MVRRVSIIKDEVPQVLAAIAEITKKQVLVGIPDDNADREDDEQEEGPINNAALGYIHETGSPKANIPARPFLVPGVNKSLPESTAYLKTAAEAMLHGNVSKANKALAAAGVVAAASAKREISTASFVPLKPSTVARRRNSRQTKSMRKSEIAYLKLIRQGADPTAAQDATGIQPLINTGQLRNALTSVVREK